MFRFTFRGPRHQAEQLLKHLQSESSNCSKRRPSVPPPTNSDKQRYSRKVQDGTSSQVWGLCQLGRIVCTHVANPSRQISAKKGFLAWGTMTVRLSLGVYLLETTRHMTSNRLLLQVAVAVVVASCELVIPDLVPESRHASDLEAACMRMIPHLIK